MADGLVTADGGRALDDEQFVLIDLLFLLVADWPIFCSMLLVKFASQSTDVMRRSIEKADLPQIDTTDSTLPGAQKSLRGQFSFRGSV